MKIVFYEVGDEDQASLTQLLSQNPATKDMEVEYIKEKLSPGNLTLAKTAEGLGVFVNSEVRKQHIDELPNLKLIVTLSTGFDHIDTAYAKAKGITVCNVPAYGSRTVAEFTFSLILGLSRKTFAAYRQAKENHNFSITNFEGFNLQGKTIGIVGTGRIGQNVAQIAKGFDMNILGYDAFPNQAVAKNLGFTYVSLTDLLAQSDIVTLHVPYNKDTHHLINKQNIAAFKKGALLINTSRGEVAETESLMQGLELELLGGVGIDVIEGERQLADEWHVLTSSDQTAEQLKTLAEDNALLDHPRVAYTPHIAFFSKEAKHEIIHTTVENIAGFVSDQPKNIVA